MLYNILLQQYSAAIKKYRREAAIMSLWQLPFFMKLDGIMTLPRVDLEIWHHLQESILKRMLSLLMQILNFYKALTAIFFISLL